MYIIEFEEKWITKEGKVSLCKVLQDSEVDTEVSELLTQYIKDLSELIAIKLSVIKKNYSVPEDEIKRLNELIEELKHAHEIQTKK
jgi:hypothetical protein